MSRPSIKHRVPQSLFWNPVGASVVHRLIQLERKFDVVVRNHSLIGDSNGDHLFNGILCPLHYSVWIDTPCTLCTMYVGVSRSRLALGDIPIRNYRF